MKPLISHWLPWFISGVTILTMFLVGEKQKRAWLLGLFNQALWLTWIATTKSWGLLPMTAAIIVVYGRNYLKWK